eukprot:TRINITY_DN1684_c1_g1_i1.p3 TRINITY_DN1684_c1_g1~~TRINITY_DN1684_c1_g1_i1.p3  ORF type:complete len:101 (-),score=4.53 TRINITY_DN1684_c1_g1_i1:446-748(-)
MTVPSFERVSTIMSTTIVMLLLWAQRAALPFLEDRIRRICTIHAAEISSWRRRLLKRESLMTVHGGFPSSKYVRDRSGDMACLALHQWACYVVATVLVAR